MYQENEFEGEETVCEVNFCYSRRSMTMVTETDREGLVRINYTRKESYVFC